MALLFPKFNKQQNIYKMQEEQEVIMSELMLTAVNAVNALCLGQLKMISVKMGIDLCVLSECVGVPAKKVRVAAAKKVSKEVDVEVVEKKVRVAAAKKVVDGEVVEKKKRAPAKKKVVPEVVVEAVVVEAVVVPEVVVPEVVVPEVVVPVVVVPEVVVPEVVVEAVVEVVLRCKSCGVSSCVLDDDGECDVCGAARCVAYDEKEKMDSMAKTAKAEAKKAKDVEKAVAKKAKEDAKAVKAVKAAKEDAKAVKEDAKKAKSDKKVADKKLKEDAKDADKKKAKSDKKAKAKATVVAEVVVDVAEVVAVVADVDESDATVLMSPSESPHLGRPDVFLVSAQLNVARVEINGIWFLIGDDDIAYLESSKKMVGKYDSSDHSLRQMYASEYDEYYGSSDGENSDEDEYPVSD